MLNPSKELYDGVKTLKNFMDKHGFEYKDVASGASCGGFFASGSFGKDDRRIVFSVRWSLGQVYYEIGDMMFEHDDYMRAADISNQYPGFSKSTSVAFNHLLSDLEDNPLFFQGEDKEIKEKADQAKRTKKTGFAALSGVRPSQ